MPARTPHATDPGTVRVVARVSGEVTLARRETQDLTDLEVRVGVRCVGLCRTDVLVARGALPCTDGRVLGHEAAGVVLARGAAVYEVEVGAHVALLPFVRCRRCAGCAEGAGCFTPERLGVERDGAFTDELVVPWDAVVVVPRSLSWRHAAYVEPVAAALAPLSAGLDRELEGAIVGTGRIAELTRRVLLCSGFTKVRRLGSGEPGGTLAWTIDTEGSAESLACAIASTSPRGTVVLKSRPAGPVPIPIGELVSREIVVRSVAYAPFPSAVALLASGRLVVDDLFGSVGSLSELAAMLVRGGDESRKQFFAPDPDLLRGQPEGTHACAD